ncbi:nucleoside 2-deoxyribosyltransferase [Ewingella americana]|nr:nucleoside 2-deoxyribosyltransferase [Ewingella americana]
MKVYIAGPMTGLPHFNRPAFQQAAINLSFEKHVPLNPAILPDGLTEADYMAIGLMMLQRAEAIYLLNGWQFSAGARAEHALALKLGLEVIEQGERSHH